MIAKIAGRQSTYEVDVLKKFDFEGKSHAVHIGHNSLIRTIVVSDFETGFPRKVYGRTIDEELDEDNLNRYIDDFKKESVNKIEVPKTEGKVNT